MTELYLALLGILGTAGTGFTGWFFGRKKTAAEVVSANIDNDIKLSNHYREMLDDLAPRYLDKLEKFKAVANIEIKLHQEEIKFLKKKIQILQQENRELRAEVKRLKIENNNLISANGSNRNQ